MKNQRKEREARAEAAEWARRAERAARALELLARVCDNGNGEVLDLDDLRELRAAIVVLNRCTVAEEQDDLVDALRYAAAIDARAQLPPGTSIEVVEPPDATPTPLLRSTLMLWDAEDVERAAIAVLNALGLVAARPGEVHAGWNAKTYAAVCGMNPGFHVKASNAGRFLLDSVWKAAQHGSVFGESTSEAIFAHVLE